MRSVSKLRVSHTVIPYSFPCCIPLSEIERIYHRVCFVQDVSVQTMVSTESRDDRLPGQMYDELVTGDGFVYAVCMLCVCCVYVVCMLKTGNPSPVLKNKRVFFVCVCCVCFFQLHQHYRACVRVRVRARNIEVKKTYTTYTKYQIAGIFKIKKKISLKNVYVVCVKHTQNIHKTYITYTKYQIAGNF